MADSDCLAASWTHWLKLKLFGAMYPICATNDCSDSLDDWLYVLSHFFFMRLNLLITHFTGMDFPLVGDDHLNGTSFEAFNTLSILSLHG